MSGLGDSSVDTEERMASARIWAWVISSGEICWSRASRSVIRGESLGESSLGVAGAGRLELKLLLAFMAFLSLFFTACAGACRIWCRVATGTGVGGALKDCLFGLPPSPGCFAAADIRISGARKMGGGNGTMMWNGEGRGKKRRNFKFQI